LSVKFSSDDKMILSGSMDKLIKLWDLTNRSLIKDLTGNIGTVIYNIRLCYIILNNNL
jgi:WD40 repeat protein